MKTIKDLNKKLVRKESGIVYVYVINNSKFEIHEFNDCKGWCLNSFEKYKDYDYQLVDSYGYNGFTLKECKNMILLVWNMGEIK